MKTPTGVMALMILGSSLIAGCHQDPSVDDAKEEMVEAADAAGELAVEKKEAAQEALEDRLDRLENDWIRMKAQAEGKGKLGQEWAVMKDEVDESLHDAREALSDLRETEGERWEEARADVEARIDALKESIDDATAD